MHRIYHALFLTELNVFLFISWVYSLIKNSNKKGTNNKILALPYYPLNYAGGHSRIGDWKPYFENEKIQYDVHWASESEEFVKEFYSDSWSQKYLFYHKILCRRFKTLFSVSNYDSVWIQRAFVPFYPFKDAYFEKILRRINNNIIVDYYDADYESNYNLTLNTAKTAKRVTVASLFLVDFFNSKGVETDFIRFAMNFNEYHVNYRETKAEKITIGWMGSPVNFNNLLQIENELIEIEKKFQNVEFHFICRELKPIQLKRLKHFKWGDEGFNYHEAIAKFDIGLSPMLNASERDRAKTAFKTLEYMASGVSFVTSPWGISDKLEDGGNCLFAVNSEEWLNQLERLITDNDLRKEIGIQGRKTLEKWHSYEQVYPKLKRVLTS